MDLRPRIKLKNVRCIGRGSLEEQDQQDTYKHPSEALQVWFQGLCSEMSIITKWFTCFLVSRCIEKLCLHNTVVYEVHRVIRSKKTMYIP